ncbi:NAD(P)/FAD-dependent oxidoreductase [Dactylosporangium aurantiacum]|uniref:NAD(P)/FAD-dependent oxidoreductase n=1 Tax=Dactylosporangium aurantiacum TaxID=35754 RepID=A0A9Q9MQ84_9ACTN|nr:NAD(P)/FAD-dependent oxidoreductase [Dactylosporangium aurantiacum]MDG6108493.1 NAD(P)/FAD-dependent oxidoreductase [Dactylosporangium aurantiacum]UWZ57327.1 NAD(P)/FAD-dependent oxidoreductase [Dactylosporangium aurantiacum]
MQSEYDVVVIGGGAAGLSAALTLSRARRRVLVVDAGSPRNAPAGHVHNYLGRENTPPGELLAIGREEVALYGGEVRPGTVTAVRPGTATRPGTADRLDGDQRGADAGREWPRFVVELADGTTVGARRVLVTTGLVDELPDIPGVAEHWGSRVLHCPYCHGWEVRDRPVAILGLSAMSAHQALLWRQWTPNVTLLLHTAPTPTDEELAKFARRGIRIVEGEVTSFGADGARLADGTLVPVEALVLMSRVEARADALAPLGLKPADFEANGHRFGTHLPSGMGGATTVPGLYVAGNVTDPMATVIAAAAAGVSTGGMLNMDLVMEDSA